MNGPSQYLQSRLTRSLLCGGLGCFIGISTGVVALGGGVNGAVVFGPIGFVIGWLMPTRWLGTGAEPSLVVDPAVVEVEATQDTVEQPEAPRSDYQRVEDSLSEMMPIVGRILGSVWNLEMRLLIAIGLMPYLVRHGWLLIGIAFVLLAVVFPLGIIFTVTGVAAMNYGAEAGNNFIIDLKRPVV